MVAGPTSHITAEQCLCPSCRATNRIDANFCIQCGASLLLGKMYRIISVIKEGGMGTVYRGVDQWGELCALKELRDQFTDPKERESGIRRFMEEGRLLHSLQDHPAIPKVYRSFVDNGRYYLAMEFIHGDDLEDMLRRRKTFSESQVLLWGDQLADVLQFMHDNGLIYRDMKPSNVMIERDGHIKVVDFGIAQLLRPGHRGTMIGTPGYAPPEQYQGITNSQSDIYALAATLHHLLTGRDPRDHPPFSFPPAHTINADVTRNTSRVLQKALSMEMEDRYPRVEDFRRALPIRDLVPPAQLEGNGARRRTAPGPVKRQMPTPPSTPQRQPGAWGRRIRRALLAAMIASGLAYTSDSWVPSLAGAFNQAVEQLTAPAEPELPTPSNEPNSSVTVPNSAAPQPSPSGQPQTSDPASALPSASTSTLPSASAQPSNSASGEASPSLSPQSEVFRAVVTVEVPFDANDQETYGKFEEAFLEQVRQTYPNAELDETLRVNDPDPSRKGEEVTEVGRTATSRTLRADIRTRIIINP